MGIVVQQPELDIALLIEYTDLNFTADIQQPELKKTAEISHSGLNSG